MCHKKKIVLFDMDGVLVKYVPEHYKGEDPIYFHKGIHFFRNLQADETACALFNALAQDGYDCYVLSRVSEKENCVEEHTADKMIWLENHFPNLAKDHIIISTKSKPEALASHGLTIGENTILIDDFNPNLNDWGEDGGIPIKYLNGVNSPESFSGLKLSSESSIDELKNIIERI